MQSSVQKIASLTVALISLASPAAALDCRQDKAIYSDEAKSLALRFTPATSDAVATSHTFSLTLAKAALDLTGVVLPADGALRANGLLMYQCPDGDVTGADLAKCTIWDGVFYAISADGTVSDLPSAGDNAAARLILSDLGRQAMNSQVWANSKIADIPAEVLTLEGCAS